MGLLGNFGTSLTLLLAHLSLFRAHREHKVHNIVLYPDKESWCKTTPIKQVVTWPSCSSQELDNNVCVGACFSYMVPHSEPSAPGDLIRPYCDSCQPLDSIWHTVTLDCKDKDDNPTTMQKKVQIITNCSCSSCMESSRIKPDLNSLLQSLELESARMAGAHNNNHHHHHNHHQQQQQQQQQIHQSPTPPPTPLPPLDYPASSPTPLQQQQQHHQSQQQQQQQQFDVVSQQQQQQQQHEGLLAVAPEPGVVAAPGTGGASESPVATAPLQQSHGTATTTTATAAGNNQSHASEQQQAQAAPGPEAPLHETPDLLLNPNLNGSSKAAAGPAGAGKAHERFFQLFKQLNDPSLADDKLEKLAKLASLEKLEKLEKLATEYAGAKELLAKLSELLHKYSSQDEQSSGLEGTLSTDDDEANDDGPSEEQVLQLLASSTTSAPIPELKKDEDDEEVPSLQDQQLRVAASLLHRTGPHHSLVLDSGVKEKIDVESHYLHPALAGQEISYHDNVLHEKTNKKDF